MPRKKRNYKRDIKSRQYRDSRLFVIICEGAKREPEYFKVFQNLSRRIKLEIVENNQSDNSHTKSSPKWLLDKTVDYLSNNDIKKDDLVYLVLDVDRWKTKDLISLQNEANKNSWNFIVSNPCFEVWLYYHYRNEVNNKDIKTCKDFKFEISKFETGGYNPIKFIKNIEIAIQNCKKQDNYDQILPSQNTSHVYKLIENLFEFAPNIDKEEFFNYKLNLLG